MKVSLRELLRMTLELADRQEVSLGEELKFVNGYLAIVRTLSQEIRWAQK